MKTKVLKVCFSSFLLIGMIIACQKEIEDSHYDGAPEIMDAKIWYQNLFSQDLSFKSEDLTKGETKATPNWGQATYQKHKDFSTVEASLITSENFGFSTEECNLAYRESEDTRFIKSSTRIVILSNKKKKEKIGFLMTIIPEKAYQIKTNFKSFSSSYLKWQNEFSGYILYHNLDGNYSNGWKLSNGNVIRTVKQIGNNNNGIKLTPEGKGSLLTLHCWDIYLTKWYEVCYLYNNDAPTTRPCHIEAVNTYLYSECEEVDGGEGNGGGYTPPPPPPPPAQEGDVPCFGDPMLNISIASSGASGIIGGTYGCVRPGDEERCDFLHSFHGGVDIACPQNTAVFAMHSGTVIAICDTFEVEEYSNATPTKKLGNYITIRTTDELGNNLDITYSHLNSVNVTNNQVIETPMVIGASGITGNATYVPNPHVHIQCKLNGTSVNPATYFESTINSDGTITNNCDPDSPFLESK